MDVLGGYPGIILLKNLSNSIIHNKTIIKFDETGLPGLLVAGLTCGCLSSVSSALNALPAIIVEDYVKHYRTDLNDKQLGYISKAISAIGGLLSFSLVFVIAAVGNILPVRP